MGRMLLVAVILMLSGCGGARPEPQPIVDKKPDCVNDPFNYNFYSSEDQTRITYCYAVLQTIAKERSKQ